MRLAFVIKTLDSGGGGAERVLTQVTSFLARRGHDVTLISFGGLEEPDFYKVDPAIRRVWLSIGNTQARSGVSDILRRIAALRRELQTLAPDAAVGFMNSAYVPLSLAAAGLRLPVVASEHIVFDHYGDRPLERFTMRAIAPLLARITVISEAVRRSFPRTLANRMTIIPNPVAAINAAADPIGGRSKLLLSVGRLSEQKDQRTLIMAFERIADKHPDWNLRIIGEGHLRPQLEAMIAASGLTKRIQLAGTIRDIEREYGKAQLFVLPSRYESFGLATAEALSAGIPAIGFADCLGTNEVIKHGTNGLLVEGLDRTEALADGLNVLMSSSELRRRLGSAAPAMVSQFALNKVGDEWERLLQGLTNEKRRNNDTAPSASAITGT
jgi:glycosyltransferase involved in cell wall biosynthesis